MNDGRVGLLAACNDPKLFGLKPWPVQRRLLEAVEQGPRLHVWALGRRSGKTTMAALVCLWDCLFRPELQTAMRPGERRHAVAVATGLKQARLILNAARSIVATSPLLSSLLEAETKDELLFTNGTALTAFPCESRSGRGWPISTLVMDEAAHFLSETEGPAVAERVWQALVPATAQFGDSARLIVSSTPWGQSGLFAELYQQAASGELEDAVAQHATTREANPTIADEFLAREQARDPEGFRSEYLAEFAGSGAAFLDPDRIEEALAKRTELPPEFCTDWVAGLDPAFSSDPFGLAIVGRDPADRQQLRLGLVQSWRPSRTKPDSFEERRAIEDAVLDEVAAVCLRYRARLVTDQYAAKSIVNYLQRKGLAVRTEAMTAATKTAAFTALRARLNLGGLELYNGPGLVAELRRLRTKYAAGASSVVNPRAGGSHGDLAQALALAVFEFDRHGLSSSQTWQPREPQAVDGMLTAHLSDLDRPDEERHDPTRVRRWHDPEPGLRGKVF